jgi:hypothetical protein
MSSIYIYICIYIYIYLQTHHITSYIYNMYIYIHILYRHNISASNHIQFPIAPLNLIQFPIAPHAPTLPRCAVQDQFPNVQIIGHGSLGAQGRPRLVGRKWVCHGLTLKKHHFHKEHDDKPVRTMGYPIFRHTQI